MAYGVGFFRVTASSLLHIPPQGKLFPPGAIIAEPLNRRVAAFRVPSLAP